MSDKIDFDDIKWGSFTKQFEAYNRNAKDKVKDLSAFARMILDAPKDKFSDTTRKRANFYLNVLNKKGKSKGGARTKFRINRRELRRFYGSEIPNRNLDSEGEINYLRNAILQVRPTYPVEDINENTPLHTALTLLFSGIQKDGTRLSNADLWVRFRNFVDEYEGNTGTPMILPSNYIPQHPDTFIHDNNDGGTITDAEYIPFSAGAGDSDTDDDMEPIPVPYINPFNATEEEYIQHMFQLGEPLDPNYFFGLNQNDTETDTDESMGGGMIRPHIVRPFFAM